MSTSCSQCLSTNPPAAKFCAACGAALDAATVDTPAGTPTVEASVPVSPARPAEPSSTPQPIHSNTRFEAGHTVDERYRIVQQLGSGGMGEVYRADDLQLGESVALKFLPPRLAGDSHALGLLREEVRLARNIAHANVCRVYDIVEAGGSLFSTMEFVDGENLAEALRRMGRPSAEKAVELARQICLGLAAAHEAGVLHRDLKPANIMIDGRGRARIADFGLASVIGQQQPGQIAGTPAYMAPEQLERGEVSIQSDLYALGLVLHELFTGRRVIDTDNLDEIRAVHASGAAAVESSMLSSATSSSTRLEMDPTVERVIERCLEADPADRPQSAYQVLAALPGGDPLAAALELGETPSPEMVAAAGDSRQWLKPRTCLVLLVLFALSIVGAFFNAEKMGLAQKLGSPKSPAALHEIARELVTTLGYDTDAPFYASGIEVAWDQNRHLMQIKGPERWAKIGQRPSLLRFWYRQSEYSLHRPLDGGVFLNPVSSSRPLPRHNSISLQLDMSGNLVSFYARPPRSEHVTAKMLARASVDWNQLFELAGLDRARFTETEPVIEAPEDEGEGGRGSALQTLNLPMTCDARRSWMGTLSDDNPLEVRIDTGAIRGRVAAFVVRSPWSTQRRSRTEWQLPVIIICVVVGVLVAARHLRAGRGDRRGAFRVAALAFAANILFWLLAVTTLPRFTADVVTGFMQTLAAGVYWGVLAALLYIALEPFVRRYSPRCLVAWQRVVGGRWRDPAVGGELLVGLAVGAAVSVGGRMLLIWLIEGAGGAVQLRSTWVASMSVRTTLGVCALFGLMSLMAALLITLLPVVGQAVLRSRRIAIAAVWLLMLLFSASTSSTDAPWLGVLAVAAIRVTALAWVMVRFGMIAVWGVIVSGLALGVPGSTDLSAWYAEPLLTVATVLTVGVLYGFFIALGKRQLFPSS